MPPELKLAFEAEMSAAKVPYKRGALNAAFRHLEFAHVLGQRDIVSHVTSHWWMLKIRVERRAPREVLGQTMRVFLEALGSAIGVVPQGNTGGTNISMFKSL